MLLPHPATKIPQFYKGGVMASLYRHASGIWRIRFRFGGQQYYRSLDTDNEEEAVLIKGQVEETIALLSRGRISLPEGATAADAGLFILSGGRVTGKGKRPKITPNKTLKQASKDYFDSFPTGAKAESSLMTERIHCEHLLRILRASIYLRDIGIPELQQYVNTRSRERSRTGGRIQPETIKKELATFRQIRNYAQSCGDVAVVLPLKDIKFPKVAVKEPFQTWDEIEQKIQRFNLDDKKAKLLWERLFLREHEVVELLKHVEQQGRYPFVLPMVAFAALTGARRSEIVRSQVDDFDFDRKLVRIREQKRRPDTSESYRYVQLGIRLTGIMRDWFASGHPGGRYAICRVADQPLTKDAASYHFNAVLAGSKWSAVKGFHVLRHSFASICALRGIPDSIINNWMGHMTAEMQERYRHLSPEQKEIAMNGLFESELLG